MLNGSYYVIEYSPIRQSELPEDLRVNGIRVYIFDDLRSFILNWQNFGWYLNQSSGEFLLKDYFTFLQETVTLADRALLHALHSAATNKKYLNQK